MTKLLFGTSDQPYRSRSDTGATLPAAAERDRLPEAVRRVATSERTDEDRTYMGVDHGTRCHRDFGAGHPGAGGVKIVSAILRGGGDMGQAIMLGTLFGLVVLVFGLVLRFDPEARRAPRREGDG